MKTNLTIKLPVAELKTAIGGFTKVVPRHSTLPVLGMIHVERDRQGWVHLTGTDLDTSLTLRLEAPAQIGEPAQCLVPFAELQKLGKICPADETLDLEVLSEDKLLLRHRIGSHPVEQVITSPLVSDFPATPQISASSVSLDEAARGTLLNALACASGDETRVILNGVYLDVSKPTGHYAVATDGRHLFASNSLHLALPSSVLIPEVGQPALIAAAAFQHIEDVQGVAHGFPIEQEVAGQLEGCTSDAAGYSDDQPFTVDALDNTTLLAQKQTLAVELLLRAVQRVDEQVAERVGIGHGFEQLRVNPGAAAFVAGVLVGCAILPGRVAFGHLGGD